MAHKILWAFSWAGPLWPAKSRGPLAGPAHYDTKNLMGLLLGWPIMDRKILWALSWAGPFKLYGPLLGPERGRPLMDRIKYGPAFGPKHGS